MYVLVDSFEPPIRANALNPPIFKYMPGTGANDPQQHSSMMNLNDIKNDQQFNGGEGEAKKKKKKKPFDPYRPKAGF